MAPVESSPKQSVDDVWRQLRSRSKKSAAKDAAFQKLWFGFRNDVTGLKQTKAVPPAAHKGPAAPGSLGSLEHAPFSLERTPLQPQCQAAAQQSVHQQRQAGQGDKQQQQQQQQEGRTDASSAADSTGSQLRGAALERCVQALQDPSAGTRRAALLQIQSTLLCEHVSGAEAAAALQAQLGKGLLRRFDDPSGAVRELAVSTFLQLLRKGDEAVLPQLPYAMPVLEERMQTSEAACGGPVEGSEEVRLMLVQLLTLLIKQAGQAIAAYAPEAVAMITIACGDAYHDVCMEACTALLELNGILGMRLHNVSKGLVAALLPLTTHKRHRVRIAAIRAITPIMHQGAHEMILEMVAFRDPNVVPIAAFYGGDLKVNFCGKLATDPHPQVRLEFLHMLGNWMTTLAERLDHEPRLLPYVLSALCDESPTVAEAAVQLLVALGAQYEREHEKELREAVAYLPEGAHALGWAKGGGRGRFIYAGAAAGLAAQVPGNGPAMNRADDTESSETGASPLVSAEDKAQQAAAATATLTHGPQHVKDASSAPSSSGSSSSSSSTRAAAAAFVLPGPFRSRPKLGTRILVQSNFGRLVGALAAEVASWQAEPRKRAAQLLLANLVVVEEGVEQHMEALLPALLKVIRDPCISSTIQQCCAVVGCFANTSNAVAILASRIEDESAELSNRADALMALGHVMRGANAQGSMASNIGTVLSLLELPAVALSEDKHMQAAVADVAQQLLVACQSSSRPEAADQARLLHVLLRLGHSHTSSTTSSSGRDVVGAGVPNEACREALLAQMADAVGCAAGGVDELMWRHREALLQQGLAHVSLHCAQDVGALSRLLVPTSHANSAVAGNSGAATCTSTAQDATHSTTTGQTASRPGARQCADQCSSSSSAGSESSTASRDWWRPGELQPLLQLLERSLDRDSGIGSSAAPATAQVFMQLLTCLDACLSTWPPNALDHGTLSRVCCSTVPALLRSGRPAPQLTALVALRTLLARGLLHGSTDGAAGQSLLQLAWQGVGTNVCSRVVVSAGTIEVVRLQAVLAVQDIVRLMGADVIAADTTSADGASTTGWCSPTTASGERQLPQPLAVLLAALDDASGNVRSAALTALAELLSAMVSTSHKAISSGDCSSNPVDSSSPVASSSCGSGSRLARLKQLAQVALQQVLMHADQQGVPELAQQMGDLGIDAYPVI